MLCRCSNKTCLEGPPRGASGSKNGTYYRKSDRKTLMRWRCKSCAKSYSAASINPCKGQRLRHLHSQIYHLNNSSTPIRRIALILKISRSTVAAKIAFLSSLKGTIHEAYLRELEKEPLKEVFFDELKTFLHTRCRPVSIAVAAARGRKILAIDAFFCVPNSQRLIKIAQKKGYPILNERASGITKFLEKLAPVVAKDGIIRTDEDVLYPERIKKIFPGATHLKYKSRPATITGHGEMKEGGEDPLFEINHTLAMIRANIARLVRRTWCTTKSLKALKAHLNLYMIYHNTVLTK